MNFCRRVYRLGVFIYPALENSGCGLYWPKPSAVFWVCLDERCGMFISVQRSQYLWRVRQFKNFAMNQLFRRYIIDGSRVHIYLIQLARQRASHNQPMFKIWSTGLAVAMKLSFEKTIHEEIWTHFYLCLLYF